jgi:hypothetical protein
MGEAEFASLTLEEIRQQYCRGDCMITSDAQLHQTQTDIQTLRRFLEAARATHAPLDYQRLAVPYLLQLQERQQEVIEYLTRQTDVTKAQHMA